MIHSILLFLSLALAATANAKTYTKQSYAMAISQNIEIQASIENCSSNNRIKFQKAYKKLRSHIDGDKSLGRYAGTAVHRFLAIKKAVYKCMSKKEMVDLGYRASTFGTWKAKERKNGVVLELYISEGLPMEKVSNTIYHEAQHIIDFFGMVKVNTKYGIKQIINQMDNVLEAGALDQKRNLINQMGEDQYSRVRDYHVATRICLEYRAYENAANYDRVFGYHYSSQFPWEAEGLSRKERISGITKHVYSFYVSRFYNNDWSKSMTRETVNKCKTHKSFQSYLQAIYNEIVLNH